MRPNKVLVIAGVAATLAGCSIMPYQSKFSCEGTEDLGKCIPTHKAYQEAVTGVSQGPKMKREGDESKEKDHPETAPTGIPSYSAYRSALYTKLTNMLEQPVTPMVRNAHVVRTLILPYTAKATGKPLYMPRYVYFFADEPTWVMGEYLNDSSQGSVASMLNPIAPSAVTLPLDAKGESPKNAAPTPAVKATGNGAK